MKYILLITITLFFSACITQPEPIKESVKVVSKCPKVKACKKCSTKIIYKPCKKPSSETIPKVYEKLLIGEAENVYFPEQKISFKARIDTGATTTSINAQNIVGFERDGKKWVRFDIHTDENKIITVKKPVHKTIVVKRHSDKGQKRYIVKMRLNISDLSLYEEVSLTDRSKFKFPVLIGRNFLQGNIVVDVSKKFTKAPTKVEK